MDEISPADLRARLAADADDPLVLDVRPPDEFAEWHVPGSENVDVSDELRDDPAAARDALSAVPGNEPAVVVRAAGAVSETAAVLLREMGYDVELLECARP